MRAYQRCPYGNGYEGRMGRESGYRAVELIQTMWNKKDFFDIVLLDWKMPDMDGIETARRIRRIVGNEVTIIVMTAYDWSQIEQEAKQAE